jgi:ADP-heptose:LPS heptosyltransferase
MKRVFFLGCNALGDTLCTTPVVRAFRKSHPNSFVTYIVHNAAYCRVLDGNPDIDLVIYNEHLWLHGDSGVSEEWMCSLPLCIEETAPVYHFDMTGVCCRPESFREHIATGFSRLLGIPIDTVRPIVRLTPEERRLARSFVRGPYAVFSMHSNANPVLLDGLGAKDWQPEKWIRLARHIRTEWGWEVIAVGAEGDLQRPWPSIRNLYGLPIKIVAALLERASCVVALENGLAHLSAGVDARMVVLYSRIVPLEWAYPRDSTRAEVIYEDPRTIPCDRVIAAVENIAGVGCPSVVRE